MKYLDDNYLSVILLLRDHFSININTINSIFNILKTNFQNFEIILVNNNSNNNSSNILNEVQFPITIINLVNNHNIEQALLAGSEIAIGDYIVEIPDINADFKPEDIIELYENCKKGNDIVFLCPQKLSFFSSLYYRVLEYLLKYKQISSVLRAIVVISSRRVQNRINEKILPNFNRNISYLFSGLKYHILEKNINYKNYLSIFNKIIILIDTLIYNTDYFIKFNILVSIFFALVSVIGFIYYFLHNDTLNNLYHVFILLSLGLSILFINLTLFARYLSALLKLKQDKFYIWNSIDKR
jgi:hypothetical protein